MDRRSFFARLTGGLAALGILRETLPTTVSFEVSSDRMNWKPYRPDAPPNSLMYLRAKGSSRITAVQTSAE